MVAFLNKLEGSEDFHQIVDFLNTSHIKFALTENPTIYTSLIQQFWETASTNTSKNGEMEITATIDERIKTIEASIKRHLKLKDSDGINTLPNAEIFEQLALMGYTSDSDKLNFQKGHFSPQWRFLIHFILHCLSPKKTAWEQFSSNIETAMICLATNRTFKFSKMIFMGMGKGSTVLVESHHTPTSAPSTLQPPTSTPSMQTIHDAEEPATMIHDSPIPRVQSIGSDEGSLTLNELTVLCTTLSKKVESFESHLKHTKLTYSAAYTKLIRRVKKLEHRVKSNKSRRRARMVITDDEEDLEDPSKQGRIITEIDQNPSISLSQDKGTSWIQEDAKIQGRTSADTEILLDQKEPTELVEDLVSTAAKNLVYIRRSAKKRKDKGKAIVKEDESIQKKIKKQLEQERLGHAEAIRLQEQINKEERQRIARDAELAKQLQEEIDTTRQEQEKYDLEKALDLQKQLDEKKEVVAEADPAHDIDWNDPAHDIDWNDHAVMRYHALQNRSFSVAEVRKNMRMYLKNQGGYKQSHFKGMSYEDVRLIFERKSDKIKALGFVQKQPAEEEKKIDDSRKLAGESRKKTLARKRAGGKDSEESVKKQKLEEDLRDRMEQFQRIADGSSKNYKIFSKMLDDFDREDVIDLHRLVNERYETTSPEGYALMLWGDLKILFEPNEADEVWKNQQDYNLISWRLCDSCGIHILLMNTRITIHMMVEKKYPLTQEMLLRMLNRRLEIDRESEMAFKLLWFIRSQLQK
ncbi:hypothetical protein Tco_1306365 [Tanacetum coccineum]